MLFSTSATLKWVRYAGFEHQRAYEEGMVAGIGLQLGRWVIGYGVYPFRILWWFAGLVVAGWLVLRLEKPPALRTDQYFWYSLENAIPLVQLAESHNSVQFEGWVEGFFHLQKLGFVVATVLVGVLTGWGA